MTESLAVEPTPLLRSYCPVAMPVAAVADDKMTTCSCGKRVRLTVRGRLVRHKPPPPRVQKKIGRPCEDGVPRTALALWIDANDSSSKEVALMCVRLAAELEIPDRYVPSRSLVDDMRTARSYPSLPVAFLIERVTDGKVNLTTWTTDLIQHGTRYTDRSPRKR